MIKRVLLLLLLVALASPVSAYTIDCNSLEGWSGDTNFFSSDGSSILFTGSSGTRSTITYMLPTSYQEIDVVFSISLDGTSDRMGGIHQYAGGGHSWVADVYSTAYSRFRCMSPDSVIYDPDTNYYGVFSGTVRIHRDSDSLDYYLNGDLIRSYEVSPGGDYDSVSVMMDTVSGRPVADMKIHRIDVSGIATVPPIGEPCLLTVYDADTRLPISGAWDYYIVMQGYDSINGSASGAFKALNLPTTSILKPHLLYVTKEGYEMTPGFVAIDVPEGGREIKVYLTPLETTAPEGSSVVTFTVTDIETGTPRNQCLVNVDGVAKYTGASGTAWFILPDNSTHEWIVTAEGYWPIGGNFTLGVDDLTIPVEMTKKSSDLPRPPFPGIPGLPVIHPSLDPAGFRMQILNVPILGGLAEPLLDTIDALAVGVNDMAVTVLDVLTLPADEITGAVSSVGQNLIDTAAPYLVTSSLLLQVIGAVISCIPPQVSGLVTFGLLLDIVRILLWGPA